MVIQQGEKAQHKLDGTVRHSQGEDCPQIPQVQAEPAKAQVGPAGEEIAQEENQAGQLGNPRGQGGAQHLHAQQENEHIIQADVDHKADAHADHRQLGPAVHLHHDLQTVGQDEADGKQADHMEILRGIPDGKGPCPQQIGQRLRPQAHGQGNGRRQDHDHRHRLGENLLRLLMVSLPHGEGTEGRGSHGQEDGHPREDVDKGQGDVHRRQSQVADPLGNENAVDDGVGRKEHHGRGRWDHIMKKVFPGRSGHSIHNRSPHKNQIHAADCPCGGCVSLVY